MPGLITQIGVERFICINEKEGKTTEHRYAQGKV